MVIIKSLAMLCGIFLLLSLLVAIYSAFIHTVKAEYYKRKVSKEITKELKKNLDDVLNDIKISVEEVKEEEK